jgi:hypothetical protein
MARRFSVTDFVDEYGVENTNVYEGFNQDFSEPYLIDQIALVKDENELLVYAVDDVHSLHWLARYLTDYKPKAILVGYYRKPSLKGFDT